MDIPTLMLPVGWGDEYVFITMAKPFNKCRKYFTTIANHSIV
jgi:hypothetical protein